MTGLRVRDVIPESIAEETGITAGDIVTHIDNHPLRDVIDYNFYSSEPEIVLTVLKTSGEHWEIEVERDEDEPLGLVFESPVPAQCGNNCIFCFVHQLPKGLRTPLYVKDEDYRLSFLYGNYVTLSNITDNDINRIIEQRLSPLYISVHATDPLLRETLLGKKGIRPIMDILGKLADHHIKMHTQIVLCPGFNDGEHLDKTVEDLLTLYPEILSLAIVPVGLTQYRINLPQLQEIDQVYAGKFLDYWEAKAATITATLDDQFIYFADEFYIKADRPFPPLERYGDLPQIENGVGMIPLFLVEAAQVIEEAKPIGEFTVTIVTGFSAVDYISNFVRQLTQITGGNIQVVPVSNKLLGESVTVTGLVTGQDIVTALTGKVIGDGLLVPDIMLKEGEWVFLDDMDIKNLEHQLQTRVIVIESSPAGLYSAIKQL